MCWGKGRCGKMVLMRLPTVRLWSHPWHFFSLPGPRLDHLSCGMELSEPAPVWHSNVKQLGTSEFAFPSSLPAQHLLSHISRCLLCLPCEVPCMWPTPMTSLNHRIQSICLPQELHRLHSFTYLYVTSQLTEPTKSKHELIDREIILQIVGINL